MHNKIPPACTPGERILQASIFRCLELNLQYVENCQNILQVKNLKYHIGRWLRGCNVGSTKNMRVNAKYAK